MQLDIRLPTLVVTGAWNPAIFQPGWIALHLLQIPEGHDVRVAQVTSAPNVQPQKIVIYIGEVGILVVPQRVEISTNSMDRAGRERAEAVCRRLFEILPHTPFGAFGVNFQFIEPDPSEMLVDKLKSTDAIDQFCDLKEQKFIATANFHETIDLHFTRVISQDRAAFEFNFHHKTINLSNYQQLVDGCIERYLGHAITLLSRLYELEEYVVINHDWEQMPGVAQEALA